MLSNFLVVAAQVGVLFLLMAVGFLLGKREMIDLHTTGQMSTLLLYVIAPCVVVNSLQTPYDPHLLSALLWGCVLLLGQYGGLILVSRFTFGRQPPQTRSVLRFAQVYSNNVFMGLPLLQAALGEDAAVFVIPSLVMFYLFQWTHGVTTMGGKVSLRHALLNPAMIGVFVGFALFVTNTALPPVAGTTVKLLAGVNTPLAMLVIGVQMSRARFRATFTDLRLYAVSAVRLLLSPLLTLLIMLPFRWVDGDLFCALVILSAAPAAGLTSIFAQRFGQDTATAAQTVSLSTLLSLGTLPLFAVLAQGLV